MRRKEAANVLKLWGLESKRVVRVRAVFKVYTKRGVFCLKSLTDSKKDLCFVNSVLQYLKSKGVVVPFYIPTLNGESTGLFKGERFVLSPWMPGRELSYRSRQEMAEAAKALGRFHQVIKDYIPGFEIKLKDKHEKWPEKLKKRTDEIKSYIELAKQGKTEFDQVFLQHADWILRHMEEGQRAIKHYYNQVKGTKAWVQVCHGDPSKRNFLKGKDGQMYIVDFESIKIDLPVSDLWRLLRRTLSRGQWNFPLLQAMIDAYKKERPLERDELELLAIFLAFPEKIRRTLHSYYASEGHSPERLLKKLKVMLSQTRESDLVVAEFRKTYLG